MRTTKTLTGIWILMLAATLAAADRNPADYPLRFHVMAVTGTTFYHNRSVDEVRGEGRGDLFANGEARGVDFSFSCPEKVKAAFGFETYPAKWKKEGKELVVLFPVFGKAGAHFTCTVKTDVKDFTYVRMRNGRLASRPPAEYKEWMQKHEYDPEHGKETPVFPPAPAGAPQGEPSQVPPKN